MLARQGEHAVAQLAASAEILLAEAAHVHRALGAFARLEGAVGVILRRRKFEAEARRAPALLRQDLLPLRAYLRAVAGAVGGVGGDAKINDEFKASVEGLGRAVGRLENRVESFGAAMSAALEDVGALEEAPPPPPNALMSRGVVEVSCQTDADIFLDVRGGGGVSAEERRLLEALEAREGEVERLTAALRLRERGGGAGLKGDAMSGLKDAIKRACYRGDISGLAKGGGLARVWGGALRRDFVAGVEELAETISSVSVRGLFPGYLNKFNNSVVFYI
jgi:hypothetical protein